MSAEAFDVLIRGGLVIDGTGSEPRAADVAITGDRIAAVDDLAGATAARVVDATDRVVAPGFIDTHGHSDLALALRPAADSKVLQGVTTEVVGNCGGSAFPVSHAFRRLHYVPAVDGVEWTDAHGYFDALSRARPSVNVASLVGHSAVRAAVMGFDERPPTADELRAMRALVAAGMAAGCIGLSFGGHFAPSMYADRGELVALGTEVGTRGGVFAAHLRDYGSRLAAAIEEVVEATRVAGTRLHVSLLHSFGRSNSGAAAAALRYVEELGTAGRGVTFDSLAYPTVGAWWGPRAVLPPDVYEWRANDIGRAGRLARDPAERVRLARAIEERRTSAKSGFDQEYMVFSDWRDIRIRAEGDGEEPDRWDSVADIARRSGVAEVDVYLDLIAEQGERLVSLHLPLSVQDHEAVLLHPLCALGTDGIAARLGRDHSALDRLQQHPRHWDTFPRLLGHYVRERRLLSLSEAIRKVTSLPARIFQLEGRGALRTGCFADLVVFDPSAVGSGGTWTEPSRAPIGIDVVFVNGRAAAERGVPTGVRAGQVVKKRG